MIFGEIAKRAISATMIKELLTQGKTKTVKGFKSNRTGKEFSAALSLDENSKVIFDFSEANSTQQKSSSKKKQSSPSTPVGMSCPNCKRGRLIQGRTAWGCNQYASGCKFVFSFIQDGKKLSPIEAVQYIQKK